MVEARELEADTKEFLPKMLEEREDSLAVLERRIDVITDGRGRIIEGIEYKWDVSGAHTPTESALPPPAARLKELCARVDEANAEQRDFRAREWLVTVPPSVLLCALFASLFCWPHPHAVLEELRQAKAQLEKATSHSKGAGRPTACVVRASPCVW